MTSEQLRWSIWAPFYDGLARVFHRHRRRSLQLLAPQAGERILLLGAGTGLDLPFLPEHLSLTAIDLTPNMLRRLKERSKSTRQPVHTAVMDANKLGFAANSFDAAILHLILAVTPYPKACLRETFRTLKPGGRVVVFDKFAPDNSALRFLLKLLNPIARFVATSVTLDMASLIADSGFRMAHTELIRPGGLFRIALLHKPVR